MTFKYASLFSGMGGFETALNRLGGECVFASEIDKWARKAYETLYGITPAGDIMQIDAKAVPDHDLLTAGFPCQAFSVAGKRLGFEDTRGTLFFEVARIAKEKRPKVLLLENVKGLIGHDKGKTIETIIRVLNDIGYTVDFQVLNSKYFGVPQNRERVFFVCVRDDLIEREPWVIEGNNVVAKAKKQLAEIDGIKTFNFDWPPQTQVTKRLRDILEDNVDERYYLSEEKTAKLVAHLSEKEYSLIKEYTAHDGYNGKIYADGKITPTLTRNCGYGFRNGVNIIEPLKLGNIYPSGGQNGNIYDVKGLSPSLNSGVTDNPKNGGIGSNNAPKIAEPQIEQFTQGYGISCCIDANYTKRTTPGDYGKGRRTHVVEEVRPVLTPDREEKRQNGRRFKADGEESFTLTAQDRHGIAIGHYPRYRIRKLTPLECFRLQGFPDAYYYALKDAGISDSQLYKMVGNAVTVNVIEAIGERLLPLIVREREAVSV